MDEAVVAEGVSRQYGDTVALAGVSLTVARGEVVALVGPNGAGKTTLVRALTGTTDAEGEVRVFGEPPREVGRDRIGLLPQDFEPHSRLTARELLAHYAGLYDGARDVEAVLEDVGMAGDADTHYEDLSGGQRRRTCVGTALINDPDLLILDEPTTGIDPAGRRDLWTHLEGLADGGTTIVVTTHDMAEAERLADRVGLLADGELAAMDAPAALVADHGGESRLTVSGTDGERAAAALTAEDGVAGAGRVTAGEDHVTVEGVGPRVIGRVVERLEAAGVEYEGLSWSEPDLEDVYLSLTGHLVGYGGQRVPEADRERAAESVPGGGERA